MATPNNRTTFFPTTINSLNIIYFTMLKYYLTERANPITNKVMFYANLAPVTPYSMETLTANICKVCRITPLQLMNVLYSLEKEMINALRDGYCVRLGDLGSFHLRLSSVGMPSKESFTNEHLSGLKVRFTPNVSMKKALSLTNPNVVIVKEDECEVCKE